jgi:DNA polymerase III subunit gamma/tau
MSYQVLARKYRPHTFNQFVGQTSICRILKNALESQRIHHAYLFTGTRGVGKTSLARLLAKCLNCQEKITPTPCEQCSTCLGLNTNRFTDLIEVDAASRTKVEDTRDLLADVHYAPCQGRYKIYLIDEVHMLSAHSFNALLKTLEEPPPHVVFLLATTEPQRLPATILSRCLQFHLKTLSVKLITQHLANILNHENIVYEESALTILAQAAQGSLRDALSLLDQAIAYGGQSINEQEVKTLLGSVSSLDIIKLLEALILGDTVALWSIIEQLNEQAADFLHVLDELLAYFHHISLSQVLVGINKENEKIRELAQQLSPEDTQLYYQIALLSRRDLALHPTPRLGFEMALLRMLAFKPMTNKPIEKKFISETNSTDSLKDPVNLGDTKSEDLLLRWITLIGQLNLTGMTHTFAYQCLLQDYSNNQVTLLLDPKQTALHTPKQEKKLAQAFSNHFGKSIILSINLGSESLLTPARHEQQQNKKRLQDTTTALQQDPTVQAIMQTFDAKVQPESIQFLD